MKIVKDLLSGKTHLVNLSIRGEKKINPKKFNRDKFKKLKNKISLRESDFAYDAKTNGSITYLDEESIKQLMELGYIG